MAQRSVLLGVWEELLFSIPFETITGILLMFYYVPDVNRAYADMVDLMYVVPFGRFFEKFSPLGCARHGDHGEYTHASGVFDRFV